MASISIPIAARRNVDHGILSWVATVDHKKIGIMYMVMAFTFFIMAGVLALFIRLQLAAPNLKIVDENTYNQLFTMHGTAMIFLFAIPMLVGGFGNFFVPIMLGARDVAFPRINAFSFWITLGAGLVMGMGFIFGFRSDATWTAYVPYSLKSTNIGMDIWLLGLILNGIGSTLGAVNFIVTVYAMRAPGMTTWRIPMFVWAMIVTAGMILLATPVLTAALIMLVADRNFSTQFFTANNARLYQHMFWFYSHPAVYIMVVPAMGIISEVLPVFSRKPIFGPKAIIISTILIGVLGFTTWAHHMFVSGIKPELEYFFMFTTMVIAVPTGVKMFNWIATLWRGSLNFKTPLLMAFGFLSTFLVGGITGVIQGMAPVDAYLHNTYWVIAHFHYVLFGGSVFGIFAGMYYWVPKILGRMFDDRLGRAHAILMWVGFNITFFPMHILGLRGMPRRIATYDAGRGWDLYNLVATIGAFMIAFSVLLFIINCIKLINGEKAGKDPWEGNTLEWTTDSPPPEYNFATIPTVTSERPHFDERMKALGIAIESKH